LSTRLRSALVYALSALILTGVVITTAFLGLGIRTTYGSGIDPRLGSQVERDFLADQGAESAALSNNDPGAISSRLTGNAQEDLSQQISDQSAAGAAPTVNFQAGSLTILRAQDPIDLSLLIEVIEDGTKTITSSAGPNSAPSQQTVSFHGNVWLRKDASGRYLIADQKIQNQTPSILPTIALAATAVAWIALASGLVLRRRSRLTPAIAAQWQAVEEGDAVATAPAFEPIEAPMGPMPGVVIRTFGGLQLHQDGQEWAAALKARPVTAFLWLRLLVAAIRDPNARPSRDELGRQASPGLDRETQLKQMRNVVYNLRELPPALRDQSAQEQSRVRGSECPGACSNGAGATGRRDIGGSVST
jgi:hypothetical protein